MTRFQWSFLVLLALIVTTAGIVTIPTLRTSPPGRIIRFCLGEAGATQWVNDTADEIETKHWTSNLQTLSEGLITEFDSKRSELPKAEFSEGQVIPIEKPPPVYRHLAGVYRNPELLLRTEQEGKPPAIIISWGHMRQAIVIFSPAPSTPPTGFFVRRVSDQVYVVAAEN